MTLTAIGDLSRHFVALRQNTRLKSEVQTLGQELTTGIVSDATERLRGETARLGHLDRRMAMIESHLSAGREIAQILARMQASLGDIDSRRETLAAELIALPPSLSETRQADLGASAEGTMSAMVAALNTRVAGEALFAGRDVEGAALADAGTMLDDLSAALAGAGDGAAVIARVESWFMDAGGGFEAGGYLGDTGPVMEHRLGDGRTALVDARADDVALREVLAATALAALVGRGVLAGDAAGRTDLLRESGARLIGASEGLTLVQARLGRAEEIVEESATRQAAERTALAIQRNEMVAADPFETASRLQEVQTRLETSYMVTARLARLTLAEYMR